MTKNDREVGQRWIITEDLKKTECRGNKNGVDSCRSASQSMPN